MTNPNIPEQSSPLEKSEDDYTADQAVNYNEQDDWMTQANDESLRQLNQLREDAGLPPIE